MIDIFTRILKNKNFVVWLILFVFIIYKTFDMIFYIKLYIMQEAEITNNIYLFYSYMFPLAFTKNSVLFSSVADLSFLILISYVVVNYVDFFLIKNPSSTLSRIDRKKFIKELSIINIIFSLIIFLIYLIIFFVMAYIVRIIDFTITLEIILPIIIKILITILIPNIYLFFFIKTDNLLLTTGFLIIIYVLIGVFLSLLFNEMTLIFDYIYLIILIFILVNVFMYVSIINTFKRRDV